jgi:hypothetical protein
MWLYFGLGLTMQAVSLALILRRLHRERLSHYGFLFVLIACIYHGLTEIIQLLFPGYNYYRTLVDQRAVYNWFLIVSAAILIISCFYSIAYQLLTKSSLIRIKNTRPILRIELLNWWFLLILSLPIYFAAIMGKLSPDSDLGYWARGLSEQYLGIVIVLTSIAFILGRKPKYLLPVLLFQSIAVFFIGSRFFIVGSAIILLGTVQRYGYKLKRGDFAIAFSFIGLMAITISASRDIIGRPTGVKDRLSGYSAGLSLVNTPALLKDAIIKDFVYRLDGNSFAAMVNMQIARGRAHVGLQPLLNSLLLVVPRFLNRSKLESDETIRDEELYMDVYYGLPLGNDYIPTTLGIIFSYYGTTGLFLASCLIGILLAMVDSWIRLKRSLFSLLFGIGLTASILLMEQGISVYFITFRGILILFLLLCLVLAIMKPGGKARSTYRKSNIILAQGIK